MVFVKAKVGPPNIGDPEDRITVQYFDEEGNMTIRSGGTRAWRCNNPGNLHRSHYSMSKQRRAIGFAGDAKDEYAVYPNKEVGHEALVVMLKGSVYSPLTLREAMLRYDKKKKDYIDIIAKRTGLNPERIIKSLDDNEFESFWKAIEHVESWVEGKEDFIPKWIISGVHKKRGTIFEYLIQTAQGALWLKKEETILLATEGKLHAIVVHLKNGTMYLRPEHRSAPFELVTQELS
ncbi:MAG: hypothetical protein KBC64_01470 [Simkaniaceae bacterium]|nr:hypothetical protein [Simkaniaceae bacterium]